MALVATWQCHVDARGRLRGVEVTRRCIFIFTIYSVYNIYIYIGLPIIGSHFTNLFKSHTLYTRNVPFISSVWD